MSLINQVLRDLDAREAKVDGAIHLQLAKPVPHRSQRVLWGATLLLILVFGAIALLWLSHQGKSGSVENEAAHVAEQVGRSAAEQINAAKDSVSTTELPELGMSLRMSDFIAANAAGGVAASANEISQQKTEKNNNAVTSDPKSTAMMDKLRTPSSAENRAEGVVSSSAPLKASGSSAITKTEVGGKEGSADDKYRLALMALNEGRTTDAQTLLTESLRIDPSVGAARQLLVKTLLQAKRYEEAISVLAEGIKKYPNQTVWATTLARLQADKGHFNEAWQALEASMPAGGSDPSYLGFAGHVLRELKRYAESVSYFQQAARLAPTDGRWWLGMGLSLEAGGKESEAKEAFIRARQTGSLSTELLAIVNQKLN